MSQRRKNTGVMINTSPKKRIKFHNTTTKLTRMKERATPNLQTSNKKSSHSSHAEQEDFLSD